MKQHLGRQSGVQNVEVSLIDGKVDVTPKEDGQIDPAQLLKAVYDSGVTVAEMDVIARGKIVKDADGSLALQVSPSQSFAITPNDLLKTVESLAGSPAVVTLRGELYRKPAGKKKAA
ncbi:MAG: heavy metal-associated domain-containing protein, partial [Candidatus Acidiferrum sp.]